MTRRGYVASAFFVVLMVALGVVAAWPIYQTWWFVGAAAVSAAVGAALAIVFTRFRLPGWLVAIILTAAAYLTAVGMGVPGRWKSGAVIPDGLRDAALGFVTGFKDLATVPLPVGEYRNLLVPAIAVFFLCAFVATWFAIRPGRMAIFAVVASGVMLFFGLIFGRTSVSAPLTLGSFTLTAPIELGLGVAGVLASMTWLAWRARDDRRQAIERAARATGVRTTQGRAGAAFRRSALAATMVVAAVAVGAVVTPHLTETRTRDVIRSSVGPDVVITQAETPLGTYRTNFSDENIEQVLFTYTTAGKVPDRIRLATMSTYNGESYRVAVGPGNPYQRVPSRLDTAEGTSSTVRIEIGSLRGIWLPTFGDLQQIQFEGANAPKLADGFYYNQGTRTGVEVDGLSSGQSYLVTAVEAPQIALEDAAPPGANPTTQVPDSLATWLEQQNAPKTGAGLSQVLQTLRERGYLSHSLMAPNADNPSTWITQLAGYPGFQPSAAGHSLARIDDLFSQLLTHESLVAGLENPSQVAAIGDDEQFAVASALIAEQMGFTSRVVVGVRTASADLPSCDSACFGSDLAVWIEVQDASGEWITVDTTPQHTEPVDLESRTQRDPENITEVLPNEAKEVAPPDPQQQDSDTDSPTPPPVTNTTALWNIVRYVGIGALALVLLMAPFLTILIAKLARRKGRRSAADSAERITGGWEEYVDAAVDAGKPAPGVQTRLELAEQYATPAATLLAARADHAEFSDAVISAEESDEFWSIVTEERRAMKAERGWWHRVRSALSLKSFVRQLSSKPTVTRDKGKKRPRRRA